MKPDIYYISYPDDVDDIYSLFKTVITNDSVIETLLYNVDDYVYGNGTNTKEWSFQDWIDDIYQSEVASANLNIHILTEEEAFLIAI